MRKLLTGEPYAGKPHVRFGGRGGRESFSTPITASELRRPTHSAQCASLTDALRIAGYARYRHKLIKVVGWRIEHGYSIPLSFRISSDHFW